MNKKSPLNQAANQLQLDYNKQKADYEKQFFKDNNDFSDLQKLNQPTTNLDKTSDNMVSMGSGFNNFTESSQVAANGLFGGDQIENSFNRPLPISEQQLNNDDIGMNSLYNNNKTV